jgi:hypothetical protein
MWEREVLTLSNFARSLICALSSVMRANIQILDAILDFRRRCVLITRFWNSYEIDCSPNYQGQICFLSRQTL